MNPNTLHYFAGTYLLTADNLIADNGNQTWVYLEKVKINSFPIIASTEKWIMKSSLLEILVRPLGFSIVD